MEKAKQYLGKMSNSVCEAKKTYMRGMDFDSLDRKRQEMISP